MACIVFSLEDGSTFTRTIDSEVLTIGRHPDSLAKLDSPSVSGHHAAVRLREDGYYVQDLGSRNGTRVNGAEVEEAMLNDSDRVAFGDVQCVFYTSDMVPEAKPVAAPVPKVKMVQAAPPVSGIPPGAGRYVPPPRSSPSYSRVDEGSGCMTGLVLTLLFIGAFLLGLTLRHYKQTDGFLPNDLVEKLFHKASKIRIETGDDK